MLESDQARSGGTWADLHRQAGRSAAGNLAKALAPFCGDDFAAVRRILNLGNKAPEALAEDSSAADLSAASASFSTSSKNSSNMPGGSARSRRKLVTGFLSDLTSKRPQGLHAVLTMRSDYFGHCARYRRFAETVNATQYLVPRMERPALVHSPFASLPCFMAAG